MNCGTVDELAGAFALGALSADEAAAVAEHLRGCPRDHAELRRLIEVAEVLPLTVDPVPPSPALRARLMATLAAAEAGVARFPVPETVSGQERTATEARLGRGAGLRTGSQEPQVSTLDVGRSERPTAAAPKGVAGVGANARPHDVLGWVRAALTERPSRLVALVTTAAVIGVTLWAISLQTQLAEVERAVGAVAAAESIYRVEGKAGAGWLVVTDDRATFLTTRLASLPPGRLYELWLIDTAGTATPAGIIDRVAGLTVATVDGSLRNAVAFAVTLEAQRVERPTGAPVLIAQLGHGSTP